MHDSSRFLCFAKKFCEMNWRLAAQNWTDCAYLMFDRRHIHIHKQNSHQYKKYNWITGSFCNWVYSLWITSCPPQYVIFTQTLKHWIFKLRNLFIFSTENGKKNLGAVLIFRLNKVESGDFLFVWGGGGVTWLQGNRGTSVVVLRNLKGEGCRKLTSDEGDH